MKTRTDPITVLCPRCCAEDGQRCADRRGNYLLNPHKERVTRAMAKEPPPPPPSPIIASMTPLDRLRLHAATDKVTFYPSRLLPAGEEPTYYG